MFGRPATECMDGRKDRQAESLQFDTIWLPMAPKMEAIWIPKVVDFRSHENLDFEDPSHSLEGSRESKVDSFCRLFQLLSRASAERSPGHTFWQIWDPFGNPKWFQNVPKITSTPSHEYNVWTQSLPVGVLRNLQDPTMMPREVHKIPAWHLQGPKMTKI